MTEDVIYKITKKGAEYIFDGVMNHLKFAETIEPGGGAPALAIKFMLHEKECTGCSEVRK